MGIYLIEIGKNSINEYIDYRSGVDRNSRRAELLCGGEKTIVQENSPKGSNVH